MPLKSGKSKKVISENIATEKHAHPNMETSQAIAVAYSKARESKKMDKSEEYHCEGCQCGDIHADDHHKKIIEVLKKKGSKQ